MRPTHCIRGHPLDPQAEGADVRIKITKARPNVNRGPSRRRECRICDRIRAAEIAKTNPRPRKPRQGPERMIAIWEEYHFMREAGYSNASIAAALGIKEASMERALYRYAQRFGATINIRRAA